MVGSVFEIRPPYFQKMTTFVGVQMILLSFFDTSTFLRFSNLISLVVQVIWEVYVVIEKSKEYTVVALSSRTDRRRSTQWAILDIEPIYYKRLSEQNTIAIFQRNLENVMARLWLRHGLVWTNPFGFLRFTCVWKSVDVDCIRKEAFWFLIFLSCLVDSSKMMIYCKILSVQNTIAIF